MKQGEWHQADGNADNQNIFQPVKVSTFYDVAPVRVHVFTTKLTDSLFFEELQ